MTGLPRGVRRRINGRYSGVLFLGAGTFIGQAVVLATTPFLSRLFTPEAFGSFSTLLAVAAVVGAGASLKLELAILIPDKDEEASSLLKISIFSTLFIALLGGIFVYFLGLSGSNLVNTQLGLAPLWVASFIAFPTLITLTVQVALREKRYASIARRTTVQSISGALSQLILGVFAPVASSLLAGALIGNIVGLIATAKMSLKLIRLRSLEKWRFTLKKYWKFPAFFLPAAYLNSFGSQIPLMAVVAFFGLSAGGEFAMTQRLLAVPASIIGLSISQVYAAEFSVLVRNGVPGALRIYLKSSAIIAIVAIPIGIIIPVIGMWIFPIFLGNQWNLAAQLTLPLSILLSLSLIVNPTSQVFSLYQSPLALALDAGRVVLLAAALGLQGVMHFPVIDFVWLVCLAQGIHYVATWLLGLRIVINNPGNMSAENTL